MQHSPLYRKSTAYCLSTAQNCSLDEYSCGINSGHQARKAAQPLLLCSHPEVGISDYPIILCSDHGRGEITISAHHSKTIPHTFSSCSFKSGRPYSSSRKRGSVIAIVSLRPEDTLTAPISPLKREGGGAR